MLLTLDGTDDELIKPQGCTKLPITISECVDLTLDDFANPSQVVEPEALEFGMSVDEHAAIHMGDEEDEIGVDTLVVQQEDDIEDDKINEMEEVLNTEEDVQYITSNNEDSEDSEESLQVRYLDENMLIQESKRGRRIVQKRRFACEGY